MDQRPHDPFRPPEFWEAALPLPNSLPVPYERAYVASQHDASEHLSLDTVKLQQLETFRDTLEELPELPDLNTLPSLANFLEESTSSDASLSPIGRDSVDVEALDAQFWVPISRKKPIATDKQYLKWVRFSGASQNQYTEHDPSNGVKYVSEAGSAAFDALLAETSKASGRSPVQSVKTETMIYSLVQLSLGRSSVLFPWSEKTKSFECAIPQAKLSGTSIESSSHLISDMRIQGHHIKQLSAFITRTYQRATQASIPVRVALARSIQTVLDAIEAHVTTSRSHLRSVLQLTATMRHTSEVCAQLHTIVQKIKGVTDEVRLIELLYSHTVETCAVSGTDQELICGILTSCMAPMLDSVTEKISFSSINQRSVPKNGLLPSFVHKDVTDLIDEATRALSFLREHRSSKCSQILSQSQFRAIDLQWHFDWSSIEQVGEAALTYQNDLQDVVPLVERRKPIESPMVSDHFDKSDSQIIDSMSLFEKPLTIEAENSDIVATSIKAILSSKHHSLQDGLPGSPPLDCTLSLSVKPTLKVHCSILAHMALHSLLHGHDLVHHLDMLHSFSFLGSGFFVAKLQNALLSAEADSARRRKGSYRSGHGMGLQLGDVQKRDWPPNSSELRLVLLNILNDAWVAERGNVSAMKDVSFGIREIDSEQEIERILDPNSIYALDFLRLIFTPPPALDSILDARSLKRYDQVFGLLLRMLRVHYVVNDMSKDLTGIFRRTSELNTRQTLNYAFKYRHEAAHFVSCLITHFVQIGIHGPWSNFRSSVEQMMKEYQSPLPETTNTSTATLSTLIAAHEDTLSQIIANLLLRKKQRDAYESLERLCTNILQFALLVKQEVNPTDDDRVTWTEDALNGHCVQLKSDIDDFIDTCRQVASKLEEGEGDGGRSPTSEAMFDLIDSFGYPDKT